MPHHTQSPMYRLRRTYKTLARSNYRAAKLVRYQAARDISNGCDPETSTPDKLKDGVSRKVSSATTTTIKS